MSSPPQFPFVSTDLSEDGIAIIKYNRPEAANAANPSVPQDLLKALRWAEADSRVKVIVNTGEGKFFCAGMDLSEQPKVPVQKPSLLTLRETSRLFIECPKITIARRICAMPSEALAGNKQLLARFSKLQLHESNDLETEMFNQLLQGEESKRRAENFKQEQELKRNGNGSPQRL